MRAILVLCSLLLTSLAPVRAAAALPDGCGPVADPQQIARTAHIILLGEMHGTREYPALAARLACAALDDGRAVTLALEMPQEEQARLAAYAASSGDDEASAALTAGSWFWNKVRDGRASGAMLMLVEQARRWRAQGKPVSIIAIDKPRGAPGTRDEHMAARGLVIALTGNMHNRLTSFEQPGHPVAIDTPMGMLLRDLAPLSLGDLAGRGEFFGCMPDCRVHGSEQRGAALAVPVITAARAPGPYTHTVALGATSASLPALDALR